jgi:putative membrane protein
VPLLLRLLVSLGINIAALWVADAIFSDVRIDGWWSFIVGAAVLGIANTILKPILTLLTLPIVLVTLGLFMIVINIVMILLAEWAAPHFSIDGFWTYVGAVIIVWLVNWVGHALADQLEGSRRRPALT